MKQRLLFASVLLVGFIQFAQAQNSASDYLVRASTGVAGSSEIVSFNHQVYVMQQSIGQASVIGTFYRNDYTLRQGFIQPNVMVKLREIVIPLNLEAIVYPNPFVESITISFSEQINYIVNVTVFDVLGRIVLSESYRADQKIIVAFKNLAVAEYILMVTANNRLFMKKILKK